VSEPEQFDDAAPALGAEAGSEPDSDATAQRQVVRVRHRRRVRGRRRGWLLLGAVVVLCLLAAAGWLIYTGLRARSELAAVRSELHSLRAEISAGDLAAAQQTARAVQAHADRAHDLTTGPAWALSAHVPLLGEPVDTARTISAAVAAVCDRALPPLVDASSSLRGSSLRRPDGSFDLARVERLSGALNTAAAVLQGAEGRVSDSSGNTWFGAVNTARADLLSQLSSLSGELHTADIAARTVPPLLGADGPKNYFVSFQNEAELRGLGGLPGAFAILHADHGRLSFSRFANDNALNAVGSGLNFGFNFDQLYSSTPHPAGDYRQSTASPHFPYAARIWVAMWQRKTGQRLDGAMTLDPTALSYLLGVVGPAQLQDGSSITAQNVVRLTEQTAYQKFAHNNSARKKFLVDIAQSVSEKLLTSKADLPGLIRAGARAVGEHRLLVWSSDTTVENQLAQTPIGGTVPVTLAPYVGLAIDNAGVNKLDYYLHAALDWNAVTCGSTRRVTVTIRLHNAAPAHLPKYVLGATGRPGFPQQPGTNRTVVQLFATEASKVVDSTVNGQPLLVSTGYEQARPAFSFTLDIPRASTDAIVLHLTEPAVPGNLISRMQPMVHPVQLTTELHSCHS
jgi:hypothetical protein